MSQTRLKISSDYILKQIFSFVDYDHILKIVKNNKNLQEHLGINIINYKKRSSYQYKINKKNIERFL